MRICPVPENRGKECSDKLCFSECIEAQYEREKPTVDQILRERELEQKRIKP